MRNEINRLIERRDELKDMLYQSISMSITPRFLIDSNQIQTYDTHSVHQNIQDELEYVENKIYELQKRYPSITFDDVEYFIKQNPNSALDVIGVQFVEQWLRRKKLQQLKKPTK